MNVFSVAQRGQESFLAPDAADAEAVWIRGSEEGSFKRRAFGHLEVWTVVKCFLLSGTLKILSSDWLEDKN